MKHFTQDEYINSIFGSTFVKLILDRTDFVRIKVEVKSFMFGSFSENGSKGKNWFWKWETKHMSKLTESIITL